MGTLREFLAEQGKAKETRLARATAMRDEWIEALNRLNERIQGWIEEADADHVLIVERIAYPLREEGIGSYDAPGLDITLEPWPVHVKPIARFVAGPRRWTGKKYDSRTFGRVDLTNGILKHQLYRTAKDPDGPWILINGDSDEMIKLDQDSFGLTLRSLFE